MNSNTDNTAVDLKTVCELIPVEISADEYAVKEKYWHNKGFSDRFATANKKEDAERICKAVNNYDALVDSHKDVLENLARLIDRVKENNWSEYIPSAYDRAKEATEKATALLTKLQK